MLRIAIPLHQAEAFQARNGEMLHFLNLRIFQRPPNPAAFFRLDQQAIAVMQFWAKLVIFIAVIHMAVILTHEIHGGERRHAEAIHRDTREDGDRQIDGRFILRENIELIGARERR